MSSTSTGSAMIVAGGLASLLQKARLTLPVRSTVLLGAILLLRRWKQARPKHGVWEQLRTLLRAAALRLKVEGQAWISLFKLLQCLARDPKTYRKCSLQSYIQGFGMLAHEAMTDDGTSCEQVVARCLGEGNFGALQGRVAIITGASGGIGLENARCLMKYGCHVVWAVRNPEKARKALQRLQDTEGAFSGQATILRVELSDLTTVKPFVNEFIALDLPLHYLILNAGIMSPERWEPSTQGHESMFATNNLSHFLMTELLMPKLKQTAQDGTSVRIVVLSSAAAAMCSNMDVASLPTSESEYHEFADYTVTKACDAFHARQLQKELSGTSIAVTAVHPGLISTGLGAGNSGLTSLFYGSALMALLRKGLPAGAATTMYCALSDDVPRQIAEGSFFYYNRAPQRAVGITAPGRRDDLCASLRDLQMKLVKPFM